METPRVISSALRVQLAYDSRAGINLNTRDLPVGIQRNGTPVSRRFDRRAIRIYYRGNETIQIARRRTLDPGPAQLKLRAVAGAFKAVVGRHPLGQAAQMRANAVKRPQSLSRPRHMETTRGHRCRRGANPGQLLRIKSESAAELAFLETRESEPNQSGRGLPQQQRHRRAPDIVEEFASAGRRHLYARRRRGARHRSAHRSRIRGFCCRHRAFHSNRTAALPDQNVSAINESTFR